MSISSYQQKILDRLENPQKWPYFSRPEFLDVLNFSADDMYKEKTVSGYLSSMLIYQQLTEEFIKVLIECSNFYLQLRVFPYEYKPRDLKDKIMFGQLLDALNHGILDAELIKFISFCSKLNNVRNNMVHKITRKTSLEDIKKQLKDIKITFDKVYELFDSICDNYRVSFAGVKKDIEELKSTLED